MNKLKSLTYLSFSIWLLQSCTKDEQFVEKNLTLEIESVVNNPQIPGTEYVPGEMLVKFKPGTTSEARSRAFGRMNASVKEHIHTAAMKHFGDEQGVFLLKINENAFQAIERANAFGEVQYAEPNWIYKHQVISNDTYFTNGSLWGMYGASTSPSNTYGSGAAAAWANGHTDCSKVWVGIIDEGYQYAHVELNANAGVNPGEIPGNKRDDDGNGYIDDVYGWDFAGRNNSVFDGNNDDHGTHVAGTIGAVGGNGKGVAGICWSVELFNAKFLGVSGGSLSNAVKAVDYLTDLKTRHGLDLVATNNSWGGGGFSQALYDAIERANKANILFIAAAGNSSTNNDISPSYPSSYINANIIAVAAIDAGGSLASFSSYGATSVDIGAPGVSILSTVPSNALSYYSGTSMATPHVTGAAALYRAYNANATASDIKNAIINSATGTTSLSVKTVSKGRLNVSGF